MRRRGSVRLCDQPRCYETWPCRRHGALTAPGLHSVPDAREPRAEPKSETAHSGWRSYASGDVYERDDKRAAVWRTHKGSTWEAGPRSSATSSSYDSARDWGRKNFADAADALKYADEMLKRVDAAAVVVS